jgi:hypothetical protein
VARPIGGIPRWFVEINLYSQYISNALRVAQVSIASTLAVGAWTLRNAETGDITIASLPAVRALPGLPVFNRNWQLFSTAAAAGPPPVITLSFQLVCM